MKVYSVIDLQLIPELSHLRMLDFINPDNDTLIAPFLKVLGYDLEYPIQFVPSQHRTLAGKVVIAYQIVGDVECNDSFLSSSFATAEDRQIARGYKDLSYSDFLGEGRTASRDYGDEGVEGFAPDQCNPDEKEIAAQIKVLEDLLLVVRGNPYKLDGSRKLYCETHIVEHEGKKRKKGERKAKLAKIVDE